MVLQDFIDLLEDKHNVFISLNNYQNKERIISGFYNRIQNELNNYSFHLVIKFNVTIDGSLIIWI